MKNRQKDLVLVAGEKAVDVPRLAGLLRSEFDVIEAEAGWDICAVAGEREPDLVILGVVLSDASGYDVLLDMKNSEKTKDIPVVFISCSGTAEDEAKSLLLGAADFIAAPFHDVVVRLRVRRHLQMVRNLRDIEKLSMVDPLTNIPNRRAFDKQMGVEWARAVRHSIPISVLMIDIDHFKIYNDTYGHMQGDLLLQKMTCDLRRTLRRPADFAARWGGEEFVVLLPHTDLNGAREVAEQIRAGIEAAVYPLVDGTGTRTTVSIGVNTQRPLPDSRVEAFIAEADRRLYEAKAAGRNRVCP